jgi:hypothetical protein
MPWICPGRLCRLRQSEEFLAAVVRRRAAAAPQSNRRRSAARRICDLASYGRTEPDRLSASTVLSRRRQDGGVKDEGAAACFVIRYGERSGRPSTCLPSGGPWSLLVTAWPRVCVFGYSVEPYRWPCRLLARHRKWRESRPVDSNPAGPSGER